MRTITVITLFLIVAIEAAFAQKSPNRFSFPVMGRQLVIDATGASMDIEGYDGNELIIESSDIAATSSLPEIAKGLKLISDLKPENNTIKPTIVKEDANLLSIQLPESGIKHLRIKVPIKTYLKVQFFNLLPDGKISLKNLSGELEISGTAPIIEVSHISGPITLSGGGDKNGEGISERITISHLRFPPNSVLNDKATPLMNIIGRYANIDISLPEDLKTTIQVDVPYGGELFSDLNLIPPKPKPGTYTPPIKNKFIGELNGGGKMITINAGYGNVFIRKQQ